MGTPPVRFFVVQPLDVRPADGGYHRSDIRISGDQMRRYLAWDVSATSSLPIHMQCFGSFLYFSEVPSSPRITFHWGFQLVAFFI